MYFGASFAIIILIDVKREFNDMDTNLMKQIRKILKEYPKYWQDEELQRAVVINDLRNYDVLLISALLKNKKIREVFSIQAGETSIFKVEEFIDLLRYKDYWSNSYTRYSNTLGLSASGRYIQYNTDVVLDFPYKDTVLEGGMTKEEQKKEEIFYNEIIARDEIDTLFDAKILKDAKIVNKDGVKPVSTISESENLVIKGNNLIALHSMKQRYQGEIKMIYIDPPYNTGGDSFKYNDRFNHSTWLTFMKNRLEIARELLSEDGSIWINIDDDEQAYLKVLCDEIFGRDNFTNTVIWEKRYSPTNDSKWLSDSHDFIMIYAKNKEIWRPNLLPRGEKQNKYYKFDDNDGRGKWRSDNVLVKTFSQSGVFPIKNPKTGIEYYPPEGSAYRFSLETAKRYLEENRFYFGKDGTGAPQLKRYLSEVKQGVTPLTIWKREDVGDNQEAKNETRTLGISNEMFSTPKPERLLQRILHIGSNENDLVLDFFMGSATTQAVALKMNRKFIGIEQMDYINTVSVPRLQKVIDGEQGGISKAVDWQGGGSFVYAELMELNQIYIDKINQTSTKEELINLWNELDNNADLNFQLDREKLTNELLKERDEVEGSISFNDLSFEEQKEIFKKALDKNQLYVNFSEIEDEDITISENDKKFNHSFYENRGDA